MSVRGNQDYSKVAAVLREQAEKIKTSANEASPEYWEQLHNAELLRVLARVCEGKDLYQSFGAPGDWGYGTPLGDALSHAYKNIRNELSESEHNYLERAEESGYAKGVAAGKALGAEKKEVA
jgi:hypothetical protein